eukprot:gene7831-12305_t
MKKLFCLLITVLLFFFHATTALPSINCLSANALELEATEIDEVVILEETTLTDPCKDKYICKLSCQKIKIKGVKNCFNKQHFDLTEMINSNTKPENFNKLGVVGYSFKDAQKFPELDLVALTGFYNGRNHFYITTPPKNAKPKVVKAYKKKIKKYFEENQLGYLASPTTKPEVIKKYDSQFALKPLYFHYSVDTIRCRMGRISKSYSARMIEFSNSKKSSLTFACPSSNIKVGKTLFLGYIASKQTPDTLPVTKFSYKEGNNDDKFLGSPFAKSNLGALKGFFADTYLRVCSADRSQEKTDEVMDVLFRDLVTNFYKVDAKNFVFKKKDVNTGNGNHLHSIQYLNWAYNLNKKKLDKYQRVKDLEMFQKLYGYILGLRQFIALCDEHNYSNSEISRRLSNYEKEDEFIKYSVIGTSNKFKLLANKRVATKFRKMFAQVRREFVGSVKTHKRGKFCECTNFVKDKKFRETPQGKLFKKQLESYCKNKCTTPKKKKTKKVKKTIKNIKKFLRR